MAQFTPMPIVFAPNMEVAIPPGGIPSESVTGVPLQDPFSKSKQKAK
jgi:hypothetical protein